MNETRHVDPADFLKSFFVVAFHYVILFFGILMGMMIIARLRFPEIFRLWTLEEDKRDEFHDAWENAPELLFPVEMCLWLILIATLMSLFIGLQVAFWAPFSKAGHGIFLAVVCVVTWLQISMTQDQIPKWMLMAMLLLSPASIVLASKIGEGWFTRAVDEPPPDDDSAGPSE